MSAAWRVTVRSAKSAARATRRDQELIAPDRDCLGQVLRVFRTTADARRMLVRRTNGLPLRARKRTPYTVIVSDVMENEEVAVFLARPGDRTKGLCRQCGRPPAHPGPSLRGLRDVPTTGPGRPDGDGRTRFRIPPRSGRPTVRRPPGRARYWRSGSRGGRL